MKVRSTGRLAVLFAAALTLGGIAAGAPSFAADKTVQALEKRAATGDADAMARLASRYLNGDGVRKDEAEAMRWFRKAAENGHANSAANVGVGYYTGVGLPKDGPQALVWLRRGADGGATNGMMGLAQAYGEGRIVPQDLAQSAAWRLKAAEAGETEAYRLVIADYLQGDRGVAKDDARANVWMARLAATGDGNAAGALASRISHGTGGPADLDEAARWYRLAAELGDPKSRFNLGLMLLYTEGARQNLEEAEAQIRASGLPVPQALKEELDVQPMPLDEARRGAAAGDAEAEYQMGLIYARGARGVAPDEREAINWFRKAAIKHPNAAYFMGSYEMLGKVSGKVNEAEAFRWYRQAGQLGDPTALYNLGNAARTGSAGFPKDPAQAARYYEAGFKAGDMKAAFNLALMYQNGEGVPKDDAKAFERFLLAADLGNADALYLVGKAYDEGRGVAVDKWLAARAYLTAAQLGNSDAMMRYGMLFARNGGLPEDSEKALLWARKAAAAGQPSAIALVKQLDKMEKDRR